MNDRLKAIAAQIDGGVGFIDVGTDHGYLPAEMALSGYAGSIIASDVNPLPLGRAIKTAEDAGVRDRVEFLLCDGLSLCDAKKLDTIVIAGMGGDLICRILDGAEWCMDSRYKLILQPMTKAEVLRYWLCSNGFHILSESLAEDAGLLYQIITARYEGTNAAMRDSELFTGKAELAKDKALFARRRGAVRDMLEKAVAGMAAGAAGDRGRIALYRGILSELEEMGEADADS